MVMFWNFVLGLVNHDFACTPFVSMNWMENVNEILETLSLDWETLWELGTIQVKNVWTCLTQPIIVGHGTRKVATRGKDRGHYITMTQAWVGIVEQ